MRVELSELDFDDFIVEVDYRRFYGLKDDNGGSADCNQRVLRLSVKAIERVKELRAAGMSDDLIEDDLKMAVGHFKLDLGFLARNG